MENGEGLVILFFYVIICSDKILSKDTSGHGVQKWKG